MWPQRRQPTRLPHPWDSPGKNTGVGCHFLLQCMKVKSESEVAQLCPTLSDPMDCSLPGSSIHGIFQARVLEWVASVFSDSVFYNNLIGKRIWERLDTCTCKTESFCCTPETNTTLLINNKKDNSKKLELKLNKKDNSNKKVKKKKKKNTGVGCDALLQGIVPTQGLNPYLLCPQHWQSGFVPLGPPG